MLVIVLFCDVWFCFISDLNSNSLLKMLWKSNKKKEKRKLTRLAKALIPPQPSLPSHPGRALGPAEQASRSPVSHPAIPLPSMFFADGRGPHISVFPSPSSWMQAEQDSNRGNYQIAIFLESFVKRQNRALIKAPRSTPRVSFRTQTI